MSTQSKGSAEPKPLPLKVVQWKSTVQGVKTNLDFIGKNIRFLRRQHSWTLAELAARVGMSEGPLGRLERGVNAPSASVIYRLSKVFGVSVNALFANAEQDDLHSVRFEGKQGAFLVTIEKEDTATSGQGSKCSQ